MADYIYKKLMEYQDYTFRQNKKLRGWFDCCSMEEEEGMDQALDKIRGAEVPSDSKVQLNSNLVFTPPAYKNQKSNGKGLAKLKQKRSLHQQSFERSDSCKVSAYAAAVMIRNEQIVSVPQLPRPTSTNLHMISNSAHKVHFNYVEPQKHHVSTPKPRISQVEQEPSPSLHFLNELNQKKQTVQSIEFDSKRNLSRKSIVQTSVKAILSSHQPSIFVMRKVFSILNLSVIQNMESVIVQRGPIGRNP